MTTGEVSVLVRQDVLAFLKTFAVIGVAAAAITIIFAIKLWLLKNEEEDE